MPQNNNILKVNLSAINIKFHRKTKLQLSKGKWRVNLKRTKVSLNSQKSNSSSSNTHLLPIIPKRISSVKTKEEIMGNLCCHMISFGTCFNEDNCSFVHDLDKDLVIKAIQFLCEGKYFEKARSLLGAIVLATPDSPFYGWLLTHAGRSMISNVRHILQIHPSNSSFDLSNNIQSFIQSDLQEESFHQEMLFPSFMDQSFTNGPNVVVEPSYETEKELHMAFTEQDFGRVANLLLQFFTDSPTCPILDSLLFLIKTHSLGDPILPDQLLTVGDIVIQIIVCACKSGSLHSPPHLKKQALLALSLGTVRHLWEMDHLESLRFVKKMEHRPKKHQHDTHNFLNNLLVCQIPIFEVFAPQPHLLIFAAECALQTAEDIHRLTDYDIIRALNFLTEFHKAAVKFDVDESVVNKELELYSYILSLIHLKKAVQDFNYHSVIAVKYDYEEASLINKSRFQALANVKC